MNVRVKTSLYILIPLLILIIAAFFYPRGNTKDMKHAQAGYQVSSKELNKEFIHNDSLANQKYGKKVIEISGVVAEVHKSEMHGFIVTFDDKTMGVKCVLDTSIKTIPLDLKEGAQVKIKGICVGSDNLIGVMLHKCVITSMNGTSL